MTTILQGIGWFLLKIYEFFESCHMSQHHCATDLGGVHHPHQSRRSSPITKGQESMIEDVHAQSNRKKLNRCM